MIEVSGLTKTYGGKRVVDDLSFTVRPGVVTGFLGPNGSGKTTTLRMLLGLTRPDSGQALIDGRPYHAHPEPLRVVGALLDAGGTHPKRSARAHLTWLAHTQKIPASRVDEVLALVGLSTVAGQSVGTYSLGMAQRLGLAAALLGDPRLLILDEPVNGLDPEGIAWMRTTIRALAAEGRTVLVSSHLLAEMALTADELVLIGQGRLLARRSVAELTTDAGADQTLVRTPEPERLRELVARSGGSVTDAAAAGGAGFLVSGVGCEDLGRAAAREGLVLYELTPRRATLEDAFLRLTGESVEYRGVGTPPRQVPATPEGAVR